MTFHETSGLLRGVIPLGLYFRQISPFIFCAHTIIMLQMEHAIIATWLVLWQIAHQQHKKQDE